ncbi:MAG: hydrolase [Gemmatimonadetes bacterium]|nr:hydrolase [Gemmatimonadota bacterium]
MAAYWRGIGEYESCVQGWLFSMPKTSAGIVLYRRAGAGVEVLLVHPGGPLYARKDLGAWSFPKGEYAAGEDPLAAARREFEEEIGTPVDGPFIPLTPVRQAGGKVVTLFAVEGECDVSMVRSNTFEMEWPPRSERRAQFPEVDRAEWFDVGTAATKLNAGQVPCVLELCALLGLSNG